MARVEAGSGFDAYLPPAGVIAAAVGVRGGRGGLARNSSGAVLELAGPIAVSQTHRGTCTAEAWNRASNRPPRPLHVGKPALVRPGGQKPINRPTQTSG